MLSLESVLALARPRWLRARWAAAESLRHQRDRRQAADLGVSFLNVGARIRTECENYFWRRAQEQIPARNHGMRRRLLRLRQRWMAGYFSGERNAARRVSLRAASRLPICFATIATAHSPMSPRRLESRTPAGARDAASATTTTTAGTICSSPTSARTFSITTTATAPLPTSARRRAWPARASAGTPAAPSSTTIATAASISSSPTTSTWIWRRRPCRNRGPASTRA